MKQLILVITLLVTAGAACAQHRPVSTKPTRRRVVEAPAPPVIIRFVEQAAQFPGDLNGYFHARLRYPDDARENGMEGRALVLFEVTETGKVRFVEVRNSSGSRSLDAEAERLVRGMPDWQPARIQGRPRRTLMLLPVVFRIG